MDAIFFRVRVDQGTQIQTSLKLVYNRIKLE